MRWATLWSLHRRRQLRQIIRSTVILLSGAGARVSYEAESGDKGPKAVNVQPI